MHFQLNSNGNSYDDLRTQLRVLRKQSAELRKAISAAWPHGRNYQTTDNPSGSREADLALFTNMAGTLAHFEAEIENAQIELYQQHKGDM